MKIVIDTNVLVQIMQNDGAKDLYDPETGNVVKDAFARAEALVERIDSIKGVVVLPAPVIAEYLLGIERSVYQLHLDMLNGFKCIEISPFDQMAAIECAMLVSNSELKQMDPNARMAKLKFDRQILAVALASGAREIWTHDKQLFKRSQIVGLTAKSLASIDPQPLQFKLSPEI